MLLKPDAVGAFNKYLRSKFSKFKLDLHGVKAQRPVLLTNDSKRCRGVRQITAQYHQEREAKFTKPVVVPYKVELADVKLDELLEDLPKILKSLRRETSTY